MLTTIYQSLAAWRSCPGAIATDSQCEDLAQWSQSRFEANQTTVLTAYQQLATTIFNRGSLVINSVSGTSPPRRLPLVIADFRGLIDPVLSSRANFTVEDSAAIQGISTRLFWLLPSSRGSGSNGNTEKLENFLAASIQFGTTAALAVNITID